MGVSHFFCCPCCWRFSIAFFKASSKVPLIAVSPSAMVAFLVYAAIVVLAVRLETHRHGDHAPRSV
jgi:hypothetical protein